MQDIKDIKEHLKNHQTYPATRDDIVKSCNELSHFSAEDRTEFLDKLPEGTYNSAEEVMKAMVLA